MTKIDNISRSFVKPLSWIIGFTFFAFIFLGGLVFLANSYNESILNYLGNVLALEIVFFILLALYYCAKYDAAHSENKNRNAELLLRLAVLVLGIVIISTIVVDIKGAINYWNNYETAREYQYSLNDIYYSDETIDVVYNVEIDYISTELNKEPVYELNLIPKNTSRYFDVYPDWPESKYLELIGEGNNTFTSPGYLLTLAVPAIQNEHYTVYYVKIYRSACMGETDFTDEEISNYANLALTTFTDMNYSEYNDFSYSTISDYGGYTDIDADYSTSDDVNGMTKFISQ
jgi:hypothetical protein